ncbi:MAG: hypothetical protein N0A00_10120 [Candidatus Bathyarchaeota archaeon]|nr:hypothetical protein [Candidatus Bathyarchaeota archaeon]
MKRTVFGIMSTLLLVSMLMLLFNAEPIRSAKSEWWDPNWMFRRQVSITENSGYSLINFPVEVSFRHDGRVQPDGRDIRVIDDDSEIPYCIVEMNSSLATIMFQVNVSALSTKEVYIYYGNPNADTPNYPLVPLIISEGNTGYAIIDNLVYIGWKYTKWGWAFDNNEVVLWTDYKVDFNKDGNPENDRDLITDVPWRVGGIGRYRIDYGAVRSFGLGDYQGFTLTPIYVDINFANSKLRVFRRQQFVQSVQADKLIMFGRQWDYAKHGEGLEENIVDGLNTNWVELWNVLYNSTINPGWMAFRNSITGDIIAGMGFNIGEMYYYHFSAKEAWDWDRTIQFDVAYSRYFDPYDQPPNCRIYWCGDNSNNYSKIERLARIFNNQPLIVVGNKETPTAVLNAVTNIEPETLNLKSKGKWITAYIELPQGYSVQDINVPTIMLNETILVEPKPRTIGDYDGDGIPDLMVYFNRTLLVNYIMSKGIGFGNITLTISGELYDGTPFEGSTIIKVSILAGDVNCDGEVDIYDVLMACVAYDSKEGGPKWNPNANFASLWNEIDIYDIVTIASQYGKTYHKIFFDEFKGKASELWVRILGNWYVEGEEYVCRVPGIVETGISIIPFYNITDCIIETKLKFVDDVGYMAGIIFRYTDPQHFYIFEITNEYDNVGINIHTPTHAEYGRVLKNVRYPVSKNTDYILRVEVRKTAFKIYVDGNEIFTINDTTYSVGAVGLYARRAIVKFDYFKLIVLP